jgi:serine/threonine-protein kinase HipA
MARTKTHPPLNVYQTNRLVGQLSKDPGGAISFTYAESWLEWPNAWPVSLSLPMRPAPYKGAPVAAVFDNLLPDTDIIRQRVADRTGAVGTDVYSLLAAIGRDCVGAMQFLPIDHEPPTLSPISGEPMDDAAIESMLKGLARTPLGLDRDDTFRISLAGAQEKTALLLHKGQWLKPHGTTPTTHIFKTQIGTLNGIDLSNSVENEFYCLTLAKAFGLDVCNAEIKTFGTTKALVIERFDRVWRDDGALLRLPQEDCCQALGVPSTRKYESDGGPGMADVLSLMLRSNRSVFAAMDFLRAQVLFWLMGATDGHAKNFSIRLFPGGEFNPTPLYDILSIQPLADRGQIDHNQLKLAMAVGDSRHYRINTISARHFLQTSKKTGFDSDRAIEAIDTMYWYMDEALERAAAALPADFPDFIRQSIENKIRSRRQKLLGIGD